MAVVTVPAKVLDPELWAIVHARACARGPNKRFLATGYPNPSEITVGLQYRLENDKGSFFKKLNYVSPPIPAIEQDEIREWAQQRDALRQTGERGAVQPISSTDKRLKFKSRSSGIRAPASSPGPLSLACYPSHETASSPVRPSVSLRSSINPRPFEEGNESSPYDLCSPSPTPSSPLTVYSDSPVSKPAASDSYSTTHCHSPSLEIVDTANGHQPPLRLTEYLLVYVFLEDRREAELIKFSWPLSNQVFRMAKHLTVWEDCEIKPSDEFKLLLRMGSIAILLEPFRLDAFAITDRHPVLLVRRGVTTRIQQDTMLKVFMFPGKYLPAYDLEGKGKRRAYDGEGSARSTKLVDRAWDRYNRTGTPAIMPDLLAVVHRAHPASESLHPSRSQPPSAGPGLDAPTAGFPLVARTVWRRCMSEEVIIGERFTG
ncbi:hypothetical protein K488DRAFT_71958 [Vararia minispora EC-137]|uniref:Uncharacterized protein n=1 Tax=Vararia minispora EC-137 TaxID=1314806 RepID=A0ACB8QGF2_9AGAM|nr:hypothetical protein K488DRAFT_71958 [Vararia minispora EC-137]